MIKFLFLLILLSNPCLAKSAKVQQGFSPASVPGMAQMFQQMQIDPATMTGNGDLGDFGTPEQQKSAMEQRMDMLRNYVATHEGVAAGMEGQIFSRLPKSFEMFFQKKDEPLRLNENINQDKLYKLEYTGEKTVISMGNHTFIEVPFVKHIPYFFSRLEILSDNNVRVMETIQRVVEPNEKDFKGIRRVFPKFFEDRAGKKHRTQIQVLETGVDGRYIPYEIKPEGNDLVLELKDFNPLTPGVHIFSLTYINYHRIVEYPDGNGGMFSELIWPVTGNAWDIPVTRAAATVLYPQYAKILARQGLAADGNRVSPENVKIKKDDSGDTSFVLTYPLAPYNGMTLITNWVDPHALPSLKQQKTDLFFAEYGTLSVVGLGLLVLALYYFATYMSMKKNNVPASSVSFKKDSLSPAVLYYALHNQIGPKSAFITLLNMASKKFLSFEEEGGKLKLIKISDNTKMLSKMEKKIVPLLFSKSETSCLLDRSAGLKLERISAVLEKFMKKEYKSNFVQFPMAQFWFGMLLLLIELITLSSVSMFPVQTAIITAIVVSSFIGLYFIGKTIKKVEKTKKCLLKIIGVACFTSIFVRSLIALSVSTTVLTAVLLGISFVGVTVAYHILQMPSVAGKSMLDNLEGYKQYLAKQDETLFMSMRNQENRIRSLYNKHLPFAVALDEDRSWTKRFEKFFKEQYPSWFSGKILFDESFIDSLYTIFSINFPAPKKSNSKK